METAALLKPLDGLYAAASGELTWTQALSAISDADEGSLILRVTGAGRRFPPLTVAGRIHDHRFAEYVETFATSDPCARLVDGLFPGARRTFATAQDRARFEQSPFYSRWMAPQGFSSGMATTYLIDRSPDIGDVLLIRHAVDPAPGDDEREDLLSLVAPHLRRALQLWQARRRAALMQEAARATLERFPIGVVTLNGDGECEIVNASACAILGGCGQVGRRPGCTSHCRHLGLFRQQIRQHNRLVRNGSASDGGTNRYDFVIPEASDDDFLTVFLFRQEDRRSIDPEMLQAAHRFTLRESEIAIALTAGMTAEEIAGRYSISIPTVRTHIRHLLEKTGLTRQVDLVRLILGDPRSSLFR